MLKELQVKNFALIDDISVCFGTGLNILSGETGAGKTLLIEAINLLLGERADSELIRTGEEKIVVQGYFDLSKSRTAVDFLKSENLIEGEADADEVVVSREVNRQGKNRAFINGIFTQVSILKNLGKCFFDMHGQHDHQYLLDPESHMKIIDEFGKDLVGQARQEFSEIYSGFKKLKKDLERLQSSRNEKEIRTAELQFRISEIEKLKLEENEEEELENEKNVLKNYERIFNICSQSLEILNGSSSHPDAMLDNLAVMSKNLFELSKIDKKYLGFSQDFQAAVPLFEELNEFIKEYTGGLEFSTSRLDIIQERLFSIAEIKRKYRMEAAELLRYAAGLKSELENFENIDFELEKTASALAALFEKLRTIALSLSEARKEAAALLQEEVLKQFSELDFKASGFAVKNEFVPADNGDAGIDVRGEKVRVTEKGIDNLEIMLSLNKGESLRPLRKAASGGEISRIMLALKSIISGTDNITSMVFDEIDTGIGGSTAITVGRKLSSIANNCQVVCITHLPQIAAFADLHYGIDKVVDKDKTRVRIHKLEGAERIKELSRMLGGLSESEASLKHAVELLEETNRIKKSIKKEG
jgi:DNA repair protein RecN (Recombination protein N)